jgi:hypothetical protein
VASDRVPDPAGTLRTMICRDLRWFRSLTAADGSRSRFGLDTFLGDRLAGVEFRARCEVRVPPPPGSGGSGVAGRVEVPAVLLRHGMPWVVWGLESVERIVSPVPGFSQPDLISTLRVDSVEAAFAVAIDPEDRWQMTRIRLLERAGRDDRLRRPSRRC